MAVDRMVQRSAQVARYVPLVQRIAQRIRARLPANVDVADLVQAGLLGLMDALDSQSGDESDAFISYASMRIRGSILDELRAQDWLPRRARAKEQSIGRAMARLEQHLGHPPSDEEIAKDLGWTMSAYQAALRESGGQILYLEDLAADNDAFVGRYLRDAADDIQAVLVSEEFSRDLQRGIGTLPEKEQLVLALYYQDELTLKEIGSILEVSESRVSQIMRQAVLRLRTTLGDWRDDGL